jgi:hypothetical protein
MCADAVRLRRYLDHFAEVRASGAGTVIARFGDMVARSLSLALWRAYRRLRRLERGTADRVDVVKVLLRDAEGRRLLVWFARDPRAVRSFLAEAARLVLGRRLATGSKGEELEPVVLTAMLGDGQVEIHAVQRSLATELGLSDIGRQTLEEARDRGIAQFFLVLDRTVTPRSPLIANDRYALPNMAARWLAAYPETVARLAFGEGGEPSSTTPALRMPSPAIDNFKWISAATRCPDLVPLLHDAHLGRTGSNPAPPFDEAGRPPPCRISPEPRRRSVLFLNQCYYNFKYLAAALRDRGWDALVANLYPPDGADSKYFHGEDLSLHDPDPAQFRKRLQEFFDEACSRFGIVHSYGVGALSLFPEMWDTEPTHAAIPWDILEWRRHNILIGYTPTGCLDGVSKSAFGAWSPVSCARCSWRDRPDVCSDAKNLAWARKREMLVDLISLNCRSRRDGTYSLWL